MSGAPSKCLLWFNGQKFDHCTCYGALGVNHDIPHTSLRANGQGNPLVVSPPRDSGRSQRYEAHSSTHTKFPRRKSRSACSISSLVFMTNGPYRAIGSLSGLPDTHRKRAGLSDVTTLIESPSPSTTSFGGVTRTSPSDPPAGKLAAPSKR